MKMQDKELDELFRSNLDDLEIKPSPNVWAGIDAELEKGRRKKGYITLLSIAASIIILFMAGYLFIPQKTRLRSQAHLIGITVPTRKNAPVQVIVKNSYPNEINKPVAKGHAGNQNKVKSSTGQNDPTTADLILEKNDEQLASVNTSKTDIIIAELPDKNIQIASIQAVQIKTPLTIEQPKIAALPVINDNSLAVKPKHTALSLGGIINAMVAKVDKRKDKIIEFTDDDGESSITGVNLGIIKIKKDQQITEK
jgi:hypothetical protein